MRISLGDIFVVAERVRLKPADQPWWKPKWKVFSKKNLQSKNSPGYFQHTCVFSFQARSILTTFDPSEYYSLPKTEYFPSDSTESYSALENTLILSKIFSHLAPSTLKNCRLVSSFWESEAVPMLKSRSEIRFQFYAYREPSKSTRFFLYRHEMLPFAHPNWHVDLIDTGETVMFCKLRSDFDKVLEQNCGPIRRLSCVYCPTINNVLLVRLLNRLAGSSDWRSERYGNLTRSLIKLTRRVSALYLRSYSAPMNAHYLREIVSSKESYPRLRDVRIRKINWDGMEALRGLKAGLVRLEINWFSDECEIRQVEKVVQRQRDSLEFLYLEVPPDWGVFDVGEMPYLKRKYILFRRV
ncbi:uncharacterized protein LOC118435825 [Folsomia candida]|nr:uncharacterized protein LOC118435825 [Folsomia candida]